MGDSSTNTPLDIGVLDEVLATLYEWRPDSPDVPEETLKQYDEGCSRLRRLQEELQNALGEHHEITRFDLPDTVISILAAAGEAGVLDDADVYALGATHKQNWNALVDEILEYVHARRHSPIERERCRPVFSAVEAYWKANGPAISEATPRKPGKAPRP